MSEFKFGSGPSLGIWILVVWIFEPFQIRTNWDNRTSGFGHRTTTFMCNFGPNSLEKFIKTTSDNQFQTLENRDRVRIRTDKILVGIS